MNYLTVSSIRHTAHIKRLLTKLYQEAFLEILSHLYAIRASPRNCHVSGCVETCLATTVNRGCCALKPARFFTKWAHTTQVDLTACLPIWPFACPHDWLPAHPTARLTAHGTDHSPACPAHPTNSPPDCPPTTHLTWLTDQLSGEDLLCEKDKYQEAEVRLHSRIYTTLKLTLHICAKL